MLQSLHCNYCNTVFVWNIIHRTYCWSYVPAPSLLPAILLLPPPLPPPPSTTGLPPSAQTHKRSVLRHKRGIISPVTVTPQLLPPRWRARKRAAQWEPTFIRHFDADKESDAGLQAPSFTLITALCGRNKNKWPFVPFIGNPLIGPPRLRQRGAMTLEQPGWGGEKKRKLSVGWAFN